MPTCDKCHQELPEKKSRAELLDLYEKLSDKDKVSMLERVCDDIEHYNGNNMYHYIVENMAEDLGVEIADEE